jgi:hypothetical protein
VYTQENGSVFRGESGRLSEYFLTFIFGPRREDGGFVLRGL